MNNRLRLSIAVFCVSIMLVMAGCGTRTVTKYEDRVTTVPYLIVKTPPPAEEVDTREEYPLDEIDEDTPNPEVARKYVSTIEILKSEVTQLKESVRPFLESSMDKWAEEERQRAQKRLEEEEKEE